MAARVHGFGYRGGEGDDVVLDLPFDFVDALHVEAGVLAQQARGFGRHDAEFGQGFGGGQFHFEPLLELVLVAPDPAHFGTRVSGNHDDFRIEKLRWVTFGWRWTGAFPGRAARRASAATNCTMAG